MRNERASSEALCPAIEGKNLVGPGARGWGAVREFASGPSFYGRAIPKSV